MIVYFLTCACVDFYSLALPAAAGAEQLDVTALHGKMKQSQREAKLAAFAASPSGGFSFHCHVQEAITSSASSLSMKVDGVQMLLEHACGSPSESRLLFVDATWEKRLQQSFHCMCWVQLCQICSH